MKYQITSTNRSISKTTEARIIKKIDTLEKYLLIKETTECRVVVNDEPDGGYKIEVTIPTKVAILRGEVSNRDLYDAIDRVVDKLQDQLRRAKTKMDRRHREALGKSFDMEAIEDVVDADADIPVKTKSLYVATMDLETAIGNMELLGHTFYVYRDDEENKIAIVYKRHNGGYGLIEVE